MIFNSGMLKGGFKCFSMLQKYVVSNHIFFSNVLGDKRLLHIIILLWWISGNIWNCFIFCHQFCLIFKNFSKSLSPYCYFSILCFETFSAIPRILTHVQWFLGIAFFQFAMAFRRIWEIFKYKDLDVCKIHFSEKIISECRLAIKR